MAFISQLLTLLKKKKKVTTIRKSIDHTTVIPLLAPFPFIEFCHKLVCFNFLSNILAGTLFSRTMFHWETVFLSETLSSPLAVGRRLRDMPWGSACHRLWGPWVLVDIAFSGRRLREG